MDAFSVAAKILWAVLWDWLSDIFGMMITSDNLYRHIFHRLNLSWLCVCSLCLVVMNINDSANSHLRRTFWRKCYRSSWSPNCWFHLMTRMISSLCPSSPCSLATKSELFSSAACFLRSFDSVFQYVSVYGQVCVHACVHMHIGILPNSLFRNCVCLSVCVCTHTRCSAKRVSVPILPVQKKVCVHVYPYSPFRKVSICVFAHALFRKKVCVWGGAVSYTHLTLPTRRWV